MQDSNRYQNDMFSRLQGVIIFSLDTQYRYIAFTDSHEKAMKKIWGANIAIGHSMLEYIHREDDRIKAKSNFDRVLNGETLVLEEEFGDEHTNARSWWENRYSPVYGVDRSIIGLTIFVYDITSRKQIEQALLTSEINYRSIMDQAADGIFIADRSGHYVDVNRAGCEMLGYTREEILTLHMRDLVVENAVPLRFSELLQGKTVISERELKAKNGEFIPVEISAKMLEDGRLLGMVRNITQRKKEEARVRYLAFVMDQISSAVISTNTEMKITHWNHGAELLYGWKEGEVLGKTIDEVCRTEFPPGQQEIAQRELLANKTWHGELKQCHRDGSEIWVDASVTLLNNEQGIFIGGVTINHNVTERKLAGDELRRTKETIEKINMTLQRAFEREQLASRTDSLTGVFNRRYFFELLGYEFAASRRYQRPLSLVMFDVDFLKKINDTYGHVVGDMVLKKATSVVHTELRQSDVLARYGGDEFVILLSNSDEEEASAVLKRIHQEMQSAFVAVDTEKIGISISAGISSLAPDMETPDQLVIQADRALYAAKHAGRNQVFTSSNSKTIE